MWSHCGDHTKLTDSGLVYDQESSILRIYNGLNTKDNKRESTVETPKQK